ncbi:tRNA-specific adenosine deaminase [Clostridia bacterium]|nr:tRNA-specific adenosine deaminase [Clostridia bacterium]
MLFDEEMMLLALNEAKKAAADGEVPVGAVIVDENSEVIAAGRNRRERTRSPLGHAEIAAIEAACAARSIHTDNWRLSDCTIYVTLEPCAMCAGAIAAARFRRLVYGAFSEGKGENGGAVSSLYNTFQLLGTKIMVRSGVLQQECTEILESFFRDLRR